MNKYLKKNGDNMVNLGMQAGYLPFIRKLHSKSKPIEAGEWIHLDWITPTGLIRKP